jgi:hypothetical protein
MLQKLIMSPRDILVSTVNFRKSNLQKKKVMRRLERTRSASESQWREGKQGNKEVRCRAGSRASLLDQVE